MKSISERLTRLEEALKQQRPAVLVVTLQDGTQETADAGSVWNYFVDETLRKQVVNITTDSPGYVELCGVIMALCR